MVVGTVSSKGGTAVVDAVVDEVVEDIITAVVVVLGMVGGEDFCSPYKISFHFSNLPVISEFSLSNTLMVQTPTGFSSL